MFLSSTSNVAVLRVVVLPLTVRSPPITALPVVVTVAKSTSAFVATDCPIDTAVPDTDTPVPAVSAVMFAVPSKLTPLIVLAVSKAVAVAALPVVS